MNYYEPAICLSYINLGLINSHRLFSKFREREFAIIKRHRMFLPNLQTLPR